MQAVQQALNGGDVGVRDHEPDLLEYAVLLYGAGLDPLPCVAAGTVCVSRYGTAGYGVW